MKTGTECESPLTVMPLFAALEPLEFIFLPNDSSLGEMVGFTECLNLLKSERHDEITFYAHTKGVRKENYDGIRKQSVKQWRNRMYHECLSQPEKIDTLMEQYAACGCFLRYSPITFFAGTFWWVNHARLFSDPDWTVTDPAIYNKMGGIRWIPESYLGMKLKKEDMFNLYAVQIDFYRTAAGTFWCKKCGDFTIMIKTIDERKRFRCPKCGHKKHHKFITFPDML